MAYDKLAAALKKKTDEKDKPSIDVGGKPPVWDRKKSYGGPAFLRDHVRGESKLAAALGFPSKPPAVPAPQPPPSPAMTQAAPPPMSATATASLPTASKHAGLVSALLKTASGPIMNPGAMKKLMSNQAVGDAWKAHGSVGTVPTSSNTPLLGAGSSGARNLPSPAMSSSGLELDTAPKKFNYGGPTLAAKFGSWQARYQYGCEKVATGAGLLAGTLGSGAANRAGRGALVGAGAGALLGGLKGGLSDDPNQGVLSGALKGGLMGGGAGAGLGALSAHPTVNSAITNAYNHARSYAP